MSDFSSVLGHTLSSANFSPDPVTAFSYAVRDMDGDFVYPDRKIRSRQVHSEYIAVWPSGPISRELREEINHN